MIMCAKRKKDEQVVKSLIFSYTKEHSKPRNAGTHSTSLHLKPKVVNKWLGSII